MTTWEPRTYLRYAEVRFRAGLDLIARIPTSGSLRLEAPSGTGQAGGWNEKASTSGSSSDYRTIYDLGCGTGYLTRVLAEKFPHAQVIGIDKSPEMLAEARREYSAGGARGILRPEPQDDVGVACDEKKQVPQPGKPIRGAYGEPCAAKTLGKRRDDSAETARGILRPEPQDDGAERRSNVTWVQGDISSWRPSAPADLIFSNAALQWVPNHKTLLPALLDALRPGGVLAVQMPRHFASPSHIELKKLVLQPRWRSKLRHLLLEPLPAPETYWRWLSPKSANLDVWETIYLQILDGKDPVVNFMRGTALRPFLTVLSKREADQFVAAFAKRMAAAYPPQASGQTLFPFRRLFFVAQR